jgi:uncharacterized protein YqjF (DUF2071 family)
MRDMRLPPPRILGETAHRPWALPTSRWIQRQSWIEFLFLHWTVDPEVLRPLIPEPLEMDRFDGRAYVGVIPFRMTGVTLRGLPDIPGFSAFHELNVRTYVKLDGRAGVLFLSLDANNRLAVCLARAWYGLPYHFAEQESSLQQDRGAYRSSRRGVEARFEASWTVGAPLGPARAGTLEHWLSERYALFVDRRGRVRRGDVHHHPWGLRSVEVSVFTNTMTAPLGFATPGPPAHAMYSEGVDTVVWPLTPAV